ncbi:MAG: long-chain fatty acid--CoA ligase [Mycetocola sp.]
MSNEALPEIQDLGLGSWPARRARHIPNKVAWSFAGDDFTYGEIADRVERVASGLYKRGLRQGDRVAYMGTNHPAMIELVFASARIGAVTVFVNPRLSEPEARFILEDSGARFLLRGAETGAGFDFVQAGLPGVHQIVVDKGTAYASTRSDSYSELLMGGPVVRHRSSPLADTCLIMYTSGTTGRPKGAQISHGNILFNDFNTLIEYDLRPDEVCLAAAPLYHIAMLSGLVLPVFLKGGRSIIEPSFRPVDALRVMETEQVSSLFAVPAMMDAIMQTPEFASADLSKLRTVVVGGAPVPMRILRTWSQRGVEIQQGYGLTETSPGVSKLAAEDAERKAGSAGKAQFFVDVRVVDADGSDVGSEGTGEIITRGPNVFSGYWSLPEAQVDVFTPDGWFRTGDVAYVDDEGYLFLRDRLKDMYVSGGENVYPAEVESALLDIAGVAEAAVIAVNHDRWGEVGKAFVVVDANASLTPDELLGELEGRLAKYKRPHTIEIAAALPRTSTGKLQKHLLRAAASRSKERTER